MDRKPERVRRPAEPRWPALAAALAVGLLVYALPDSLTLGPEWLALALVLPFCSACRRSPTGSGRADLNNLFAYAGLAVITLAVLSSLTLLIMRLPAHKEPPVVLLESAAALWLSNMLVFASWYWRLDGGGPNERDRRGVHTDGAFLFPQMMMDPGAAGSNG